MRVRQTALALTVVTAATLTALAPRPAAAAKKIKLGTLAPEGSAWHNVLVKMSQRWEKASDGYAPSSSLSMLRLAM